MHYQWISQAAFDAWHLSVCDALGIPHPNFNAATGELDVDAQWTIAYTQVTEVAGDDWRAFVEDEIVTQFADGLGVRCDPPTSTQES